MEKRFCAFRGDGYYLDNVGDIIDEGQEYYVIMINEDYYYGGETLWAIKKGDDVKLFDSPTLAHKWIEEQDYYYDDDYPDGLPPGIDPPSE